MLVSVEFCSSLLHGIDRNSNKQPMERQAVETRKQARRIAVTCDPFERKKNFFIILRILMESMLVYNYRNGN